MTSGEVSLSGLKVTVLRTEEARQPDAVHLATLVADRMLLEDRAKQQRIHAINESIRLNASKLSKENSKRESNERKRKETIKLTNSQVREKYTFKSGKPPEQKKVEKVWKKAVSPSSDAVIFTRDVEPQEEQEKAMDSDWEGEEPGAEQVVVRFVNLRERLRSVMSRDYDQLSTYGP